jgi:hypothetical protein
MNVFQKFGALLVYISLGVTAQSGVSANPDDATPQVIDGQIFGPGYQYCE